jgi:hypothetical protein
MIPYEEYIWGDKFKQINLKNAIFTNIDNAKNLNKKIQYIVSHNGDNGITKELIEMFPNLIKWFGQNVLVKNTKVTAIPIGLENDYVHNSINKKKKIEKISKSNIIPSKLLYLNFNIENHPEDRSSAYTYFKNKKWATSKQSNMNYDDYIHDILSHYFILSPRGCGIDCHRTWEALYLNRYPIMKRYYGLETLYKDLPVVFVNDWSEVTEEFLNKELEKIQNTHYNLDKLKFSYWKKLIEESL